MKLYLQEILITLMCFYATNVAATSCPVPPNVSIYSYLEFDLQSDDTDFDVTEVHDGEEYTATLTGGIMLQLPLSEGSNGNFWTVLPVGSYVLQEDNKEFSSSGIASVSFNQDINHLSADFSKLDGDVQARVVVIDTQGGVIREELFSDASLTLDVRLLDDELQISELKIIIDGGEGFIILESLVAFGKDPCSGSAAGSVDYFLMLALSLVFLARNKK